MAVDFAANLGWHEGEQQMHHLLHVSAIGNPTSQGLTHHGLRMLHISSLLALGTLDGQGRPWTTLLGGEPGFARSVGRSIVGVKTLVDSKYDPVVQLLLGGQGSGEIKHDQANGRPLSGLAINLATRDRVKLAGSILVSSLRQLEADAEHTGRVSELQFAIKVEQSLSNCPKYLNKKNIFASTPQPELISESLSLHESAASLVAKADLFFVSSSNHGTSMSTNHRGGPPGFVRILFDHDSATSMVVWPEYSGNRFYQTLGNLQTTPRAGLVFPDFDTGDVLYLTCTTDVIIGKEAAALLPRSNLLVRAKIDAARFVRQGLAFRGRHGERSPYNPPVRFLASESNRYDAQASSDNMVYAKLIKKDVLTPTIARLRFSVSDPEAAGRWNPGQYVALAFEDELSAGYSHMRDDDPKSLNDDYVRTFTVSSSAGRDLPDDEFEITIRNVGEVTRFLFRQEVRSGLEVPLKGFGGSFRIKQLPNEIIPLVAGGIGITPMLAYLPCLDLRRIRLFWTVNVQDIGLVVDTLKRYPAVASYTTLFISGIKDDTNVTAKSAVTELERSQASVLTRRIVASDIEAQQNLSSTWVICTSTALRRSLLSWLPGKHVIFEDFNY